MKTVRNTYLFGIPTNASSKKKIDDNAINGKLHLPKNAMLNVMTNENRSILMESW